MPGGHLLRLEERTAVRLGEPINFACIEVWEERAGLLGSSRRLGGIVFVVRGGGGNPQVLLGEPEIRFRRLFFVWV